MKISKLLLSSTCFCIGVTSASSQIVAINTSKDVGGITEIVVTAQKRPENMQNVPISITAITASRLASAGVSNGQDLVINVPSLSVSTDVGYFKPRIRGVGTDGKGPGLESPVAVYVDGVYIASAPASLFSFNSIERVEVLKGPQGTLFGRNATGGLISVITRDPTRDLSGSASLGYGNYEAVNGDLYLAGGLAQDFAGDIALQFGRQGEGFGTNFATGSDANRADHSVSVRSKWLISPASGTEVRFTADYSDVKGRIPYLRAWEGAVPAFGPPTPGTPWDANNDQRTANRFKGGGVSLNVQQELGSVRLTSITAYRRSRYRTNFDFDLTPTPVLTVALDQKDRQFSQELQLGSDTSSSVKWVAGVYYFSAKGAYDPADIGQSALLRTAENPFAVIRTSSEQRTKSYAAFGQATVPVGDTTNVTAGLRYTHEKRSIAGGTIGILPDHTSIPLTGNIDDHKKFDKLTWRFAIDQKIGDAMFYASYNRGFKSGGFNPQVPADRGFLPETIDAFELGAKATLLDNRLRFNPSLFYYEYKNIQVAFFTQGQNGITNGPSAKLYGLDLDVELAATDNLRFSGGLALIHNRYGSFPGAILNIPQQVGNLQVIGDATGNRLSYTPDWSASIAADYQKEVEGLGKISLNVSYNHNDGYFTEVDNLRRQDAFDLVNASLSLAPQDSNVTVRLWAKNILNKAVAVAIVSAPFVVGAGYQPPRTYGMSIGYKF